MNKPFFVGINGGSGSGKTFFLKSLLKHFRENEITLVSQDDYYRSKQEQPVDENGWTNFDLPGCIDHEQLLKDLQSLQKGQKVTKKEYTFNVNEHQARVLSLAPAPVIVLEGLFIFYFKEISDLLDMKIFLEADEEISLKRRIDRDALQRGYDKDMVMYQWKNHVKPAYDAYLVPYKNAADRIILNNGNSQEAILTEVQKLADELKRILYKL